MPDALARRFFIFALPLILGLAALFGPGVFAPPVRADDSPFGPQPGVLLLRNGELIEGDIVLAGDRYDVTVPSGQMHIRRSEVQFVGRNTLECYQRRKTLVSIDKVQDHLELAEWCLRHHLYEQAALALADAVATDASHPRIGLLERRLKLEMAHETPVAVQPKEAEAASPSPRDLDRMVQGLPAGTVEVFTSTIQPMLLNHCSTAGCHGPQGTTALRLLRAPTGKTPSRRATQRNLYSVLSAIDQEHPAQSPLLVAPMRPHGQAKSAVFTTHEALQYQQLVRWVYLLSNHSTLESSSAANDPRASRSSTRHRAAKVAARTLSNMAEPGTVKTGIAHLANQADAPASDGDEKADETTADAKPTVRDPFDPQAFNDRYLKGPAE